MASRLVLALVLSLCPLSALALAPGVRGTEEHAWEGISVVYGDVAATVDARNLTATLSVEVQATLSGPFDATSYRDDYRDAVLALIERKLAGEQIAVAPQAPAPPAAPDLMAALQASVEAVGRYNARWDDEDAKPKRRRRTATARQPTKKS